MTAKPKIIVVLGPTAVGKSDLAVQIAKFCNGEIISADSRQVFKGMDIGSGKITKKEMLGVKHYMLDIVSPNNKYNVAKYQKEAHKIISDILGRGKTPIICGGTGFYIQAIVDNYTFPEVKPDPKLRKVLEKKTLKQLLSQLQKLDKKTFARIDQNNKVKVVRAIEIAKKLGSVPPIEKNELYNSLQIGITAPDEVLKDRIYLRLIKRMKSNKMIKEVQRLHNEGVSWKRLESFGLEYRYLARLLTGKLTKEEMVKELNSEIWHFAKRQKAWFKRDNRIKWYSPKDLNKIKKEVTRFLK